MTWELAREIEDVSMRLDTVVSTLQILIEFKDQTDPDFAAALGGLRDTVGDQSLRLNEVQEALRAPMRDGLAGP